MVLKLCGFIAMHFILKSSGIQNVVNQKNTCKYSQMVQETIKSFPHAQLDLLMCGTRTIHISSKCYYLCKAEGGTQDNNI